MTDTLTVLREIRAQCLLVNGQAHCVAIVDRAISQQEAAPVVAAAPSSGEELAAAYERGWNAGAGCAHHGVADEVGETCHFGTRGCIKDHTCGEPCATRPTPSAGDVEALEARLAYYRKHGAPWNPLDFAAEAIAVARAATSAGENSADNRGEREAPAGDTAQDHRGDQLDLPAFLVEAEGRNLLYRCLRELVDRIEACGASPRLTHAVCLASDLARAVGNKFNATRKEDFEILMRTLETPMPPAAPQSGGKDADALLREARERLGEALHFLGGWCANEAIGNPLRLTIERLDAYLGQSKPSAGGN